MTILNQLCTKIFLSSNKENIYIRLPDLSLKETSYTYFCQYQTLYIDMETVLKKTYVQKLLVELCVKVTLTASANCHLPAPVDSRHCLPRIKKKR